MNEDNAAESLSNRNAAHVRGIEERLQRGNVGEVGDTWPTSTE